MARLNTTQSHMWSVPWPDPDGQPMQPAPFEGIYNYLLLLTCLLGLIIFGAGPLTTPDTIELYQFRFLTKLGNMYPYAYSTSPLANMSSGVHFSLAWLEPWANYTTGKLSWYRQGLREVKNNREIIESHATGDVPTDDVPTDDVPDVLLAAAVANQGNSYQRPFGWEGFEQWQRWLGTHFNWPIPQWKWAQNQWNADFEEYSIGIAQITPGEVDHFGYDHNKVDLFDNATSIKLMRAKLAATSQATAPLELNKTDWFILVAIGNNDGPVVLRNYEKYGRDMQSFLANDIRSRRQLAKMMSYVDYLHIAEGWPLPEGVNHDHIWWLIQRAKAGP
jgi:hypothetical protein